MKSKSFFFTPVLIIFMVVSAMAQQPLNEYKYVVVPEIYEFLQGKDQYQLNSLTKFLLNKNGFNAYFEHELPNVTRCDGLYAEVIGDPGFTFTKITVLIKDCKGEVLYTSPIGKSKQKEYKKAYHEAMRDAFEDFKSLGVNQPDIDKLLENPTPKVEEDSSEVSTTNTTSIENGNGEMVTVSMGPQSIFTSYDLSNNAYLLHKTSDGYTLYKDVKENDQLKRLGVLYMEDGKWYFEDSNKTKSEAYFKPNTDFIIKESGREFQYKILH